MPRVVEIKACVKDVEDFKKLAKSISDTKERILLQTDTFFNTTTGSLKLRITPDDAQLVYKIRPDDDGPKLADYTLHKCVEPETLITALSQAYGVRGIVEKKRTLFMCGQTRIHVDEVKDLGSFMELEVVLTDDQSLDEGKQIADDLMLKLHVLKEDLLSGAYMDMLEKK